MAYPTLTGMPQILGGLDPNPPSDGGLKDILLKLLPLIISGGAGAIFGGGAGFGTALSSYAATKQQIDQLEEEKSRSRLSYQQAIETLKEKQRAEQSKQAFESEEARKTRKGRMKVEIFRQGEIGKREAAERAAREKPVDVSGIIAAIEGGGKLGEVPRTLAGPAISAIAGQKRTAQAQQFQTGFQKSTQEFQEAQQRRQQAFQVRENERNRKNATEEAKARSVIAENAKDVSTVVQRELEETAMLLKVLDEMDAAAPTLSKIIGFVPGRLTTAKQFLGRTSAEEEAALTLVQKFWNVVGKATSAGAITGSEEARLNKELTKSTLSPEQLKGRIKTQRDFFGNKLRLRLKMLQPTQEKKMIEALKSIGLDIEGGPTVEDYLKSLK